MQQKPRKLNVELGEKESEGIYSNLALIVHSPQEMIIDFARVMPGAQKTKILARIIMTPAHAKMLHMALEENIRKYESQFGKIRLQGETDKSIGFQSSQKEGVD